MEIKCAFTVLPYLRFRLNLEKRAVYSFIFLTRKHDSNIIFSHIQKVISFFLEFQSVQFSYLSLLLSLSQTPGGKSAPFSNKRIIKNFNFRGGSNGKAIKTLTALVENPDSVPSTHLVAHHHLQLQSQTTEHSLLLSSGTNSTQRHRQ